MRKIIALADLEKIIGKLKKKGDKLILVGGCFDILHPGHARFLESAKKLGGIVLVLLESDDFIRKLKKREPTSRQEDRAYLLSLLSPVDYILTLPLLSKNQEYYALVNLIKPDIIAVTKNDPLLPVKQDQATRIGAQVIEVMDRDKRFSSSRLAKIIK